MMVRFSPFLAGVICGVGRYWPGIYFAEAVETVSSPVFGSTILSGFNIRFVVIEYNWVPLCAFKGATVIFS